MIMLKDLLSKAFKTNFAAPEPKKEKRGDTYYDINVKVDSIADDYDVDKLITKIKKDLAQDGAVRNSNIINRKMRY